MPINCCPTCHGNYPARIIDVINGEADCPYCSGRKALPGKTSFAALHPDLMEDWDFIANYCLINPDEILDTYSQKVWWNCKRNSEHKYPLSPADKVFYQKRHRESCPYCKGRRRKKRFSNDICQMKISFILYVFQFFIKNQHLTSHGIMYVFVDFLNFSNLTFHGIMYVFADFREKNFFTYFTFFYLPFVLPVSSIPVVCIINTCITYDLTRLRCMNHLSASCVDSHMSSVTYNITRLRV